MTMRAYGTTLTPGESWEGVTLHVLSIPSASAESYTLEDLLGTLDLQAQSQQQFVSLSETRQTLFTHFARQETALGPLIDELFESGIIVVEESPASTAPLEGIAGAGALALGYGVFGPWAIIAVPAGLILVNAAPTIGKGLGEYVRAWLQRKAR